MVRKFVCALVCAGAICSAQAEEIVGQIAPEPKETVKPQVGVLPCLLIACAACGGYMVFKAWTCLPPPQGTLVILRLEKSTDGGRTWVEVDNKEVFLDGSPKEMFQSRMTDGAAMYRVIWVRA
jgi:hypothetical protein